jgi:uncharacterized Zn finger protein (UPF0148 family)
MRRKDMNKRRKAQAAPGENPAVIDCTGKICPKCGSPLQPKALPSGTTSCACPNCDRNIVNAKTNARMLFEKYVSKKEKETGPYIPDGEKEQEEDEKEVVKKETKQEERFRKMLKKNPNYKDKAEKDLEDFDKDLI